MKRRHSKWRKKAIPALIAAVEQGQVPVRLAADMVDESPEMQDAFVFLVLCGIKPIRAADHVYRTMDLLGDREMDEPEAAENLKYSAARGGCSDPIDDGLEEYAFRREFGRRGCRDYGAKPATTYIDDTDGHEFRLCEGCADERDELERMLEMRKRNDV